MPTEQPTPEWGAPTQARPRTWTAKRIAVAAAVALGIAAAGTGVVYAATSTTTDTTAEQGPGGGGMPGGGMGSPTQELHGEYVVSDDNGGYTTQLRQNGEVTTISATSITVASEDGYTKTYTIDATDVSTIAEGDDVSVVASVSGDTATADSVTEGGTGPMGQAPPDMDQGN